MPDLIDLIPDTGNDNDVLVRDHSAAAGVRWTSSSIAVSQATHQTAVSAPAAVTSVAPDSPDSVAEATADAATQTGSYVQADVQSIATLATSLKAKYNTLQEQCADDNATLTATQADVVALRAGVAALTTALNALNLALQTAHFEA